MNIGVRAGGRKGCGEGGDNNKLQVVAGNPEPGKWEDPTINLWEGQ